MPGTTIQLDSRRGVKARGASEWRRLHAVRGTVESRDIMLKWAAEAKVAREAEAARLELKEAGIRIIWDEAKR